jgi:hypothetical protein
MQILKTIVIVLLVGKMGFAFQIPDDPVLKARTQRAMALGISDGDLPPVPRTIAEPPPLPAPETNYKDTRKGRYARAGRSARSRKGHRVTASRGKATAKHKTKKHR